MLIVNANIKMDGNKISKKTINSGWRCSLEVDGQLIMCAIGTREEGKYINVDEQTNVNIEMSYGELFLESIVVGYKFKLKEASKVLGEGEVMKILKIEVEEQNIIALGDKEEAINIVKKAKDFPGCLMEEKVLLLFK